MRNKILVYQQIGKNCVCGYFQHISSPFRYFHTKFNPLFRIFNTENKNRFALTERRSTKKRTLNLNTEDYFIQEISLLVIDYFIVIYIPSKKSSKQISQNQTHLYLPLKSSTADCDPYRRAYENPMEHHLLAQLDALSQPTRRLKRRRRRRLLYDAIVLGTRPIFS